MVQLDRCVTLVEINLSEQGNNPCLHVNNNTQQTGIQTKCGRIVVAENAIVILNLAYQQKYAK